MPEKNTDSTGSKTDVRPYALASRTADLGQCEKDKQNLKANRPIFLIDEDAKTKKGEH